MKPNSAGTKVRMLTDQIEEMDSRYTLENSGLQETDPEALRMDLRNWKLKLELQATNYRKKKGEIERCLQQADDSEKESSSGERESLQRLHLLQLQAHVEEEIRIREELIRELASALQVFDTASEADRALWKERITGSIRGRC